MCLENDAHDIAVLLYQNFEEYFFEEGVLENIVPHLLNSFSKGTNLIEAKCFLIKKYLNYFTVDHCRRLLDIYEYKLLTNSRSHALVNNVNPVKTSCLLIEIVDLIDYYNLKLQKREIKKKLLTNLMLVVNEIDSIAEMRHLFMDQDLEQRDSLTFIWDNKMEELLKNPIICMIVAELWDSHYNVDGFIWNASSAHQMLFNFDHCKYDYTPAPIKKIHAHCFNFEVWKNSGRSRYYVETAVTVAFAGLLHFLIQTILETTYDMEAKQTKLDYWNSCPSPEVATNCQTQATAIESVLYGDDAQKLWDYNLALAGLSFMYMLFAIQIVVNAIYSTVNNTVMRLKSVGYMIDGILFIAFLTFAFITYAYNRDGTYAYQQTKSSQDKPDIQIFYENYRDGGRREDILLIIIGILFWIKVFYSFRLLPFIGPLQAILKVMLRPIFNYLVFFAAEILIFAAVAQILFQELTSYKYYDD